MSENDNYFRERVEGWDMRILQLEETIFTLENRLKEIKSIRKRCVERMEAEESRKRGYPL